MKHIFRIIVLAVALFTGLTTVSAQMVQVVVVQKIPKLPTTASNYLDDPFRYFNIQIISSGLGSEGLDVFLDIDYSLNDNSFYLRTKPNTYPYEYIHISDGVKILTKDELRIQLRDRRETNVDFAKPLNAQLLPEGTYELCIDVFRWDERLNPNRVPISVGPCSEFELCYSGSAPELVSPLAGAQMALNGAMVVAPARKINFFWSPVISNCADNTARFKYKLKVVKVLNGQNYQDAIKHNPTIFSAEVRNNTFAVFDTLRDIKVNMEKGSLYVAQVQAEQIKTNRSTDKFIVANNGNSQPMPFYWCYAPNNYSYYVDDEEEEGDESEGVSGITEWEGGVEEYSELDEIMEEAIPDETIVLYPKRHYVESDGYYTIPMTNDIEVGFIPIQHESLKDVSYTIELYDYLSDGIDSTTAYEPLFSEVIKELPKNHNRNEMVSRTLSGWGAKLEQGSLYYLQLSNSFTANYWEYSVADTIYYVNELLAEHFHDTISRDFVEEELEYADGVVFQWGDDPEAPAYATPQWKAPVDRTSADIHDPANYTIPTSVPEVRIAPTFSVSWAPVKVSKGDEAEYEVNVYELKPGQTLEEAISENPVLISRTVTGANQISSTDEKFFKVFSPKKTYVMTLSTDVDGDSETIYHFANGNEAIPIVFKVVK